MDKSEFLGLNLPSRDNTTDIADINAISENFETIDGALLDLVEKQIPELQTKENINLNFDDNSTNEEQYPSVPAVVNFANRKIDPLKIVNSASGNAIALKDSAKNKLEGLKLYGKTTQNGTPTPDAPVPLVSVGDSGSYSVDILTSNLITPTDYRPDLTITEYDGKQCVNYTTGSTQKHTPIPFKANTQYTVRFDCKSVKSNDTAPATDFPFAFFYSDGTNSKVSSTTDSTWRTLTLTSQANKTVVGIGYAVYDYRVNNYIDVNSFVFVEGTTITESVPYNKQSITFTDTLRGIGDIKDVKDFARGVTTERIRKIVFNGSEYWQETETQFCHIPNYRLDLPRNNYLSSHFQCGSGDMTVSENGIYIKKGLYGATMGEFKTNLSNNNIVIYTPYITPIETPLTEAELNAYRQLHTNKPNTTIISEADMEVSYVADTKLYIDNKIAQLTALTLEV